MMKEINFLLPQQPEETPVIEKVLDEEKEQRILNGIDLNQDFALKLIDDEYSHSLMDNLEKFTGLDYKEIALKLIKAGDGYYVASSIEKFTGLDYKEIALKLIEAERGEYVAYYLEKFIGLDHKKLALKLIEVGRSYLVANNIEKFTGLDQEIARELIETGYGEHVAVYLEKFSGLDQEVALNLIEFGKGDSVASKLEKFTGLDHKEIALKLIEVGEGCSVAFNLEKFSNLDHKEIALKLIEVGEGCSVASNLEKFIGLDQEIALKLIEVGEGCSVASNLEKFIGLDYKEIARKLIETGYGEHVVSNLKNFTSLDHIEFVLKIFEIGQGNLVVDNLDKFQLSSSDFYFGMKNIFPVFFIELESKLPALISGLSKSAELVINLFLDKESLPNIEQSIKNNPFLIKVIEDNPRYGIRLAVKYHQFDLIAQEDIKELFNLETKITQDHPNIDKQSSDFRQLMQEHLSGFRNNPTILKELTNRGVGTEQWLNYNEQLYFTLGEQEDVRFSDKIKTPIIRIKETLDQYKASIINTLSAYKPELQASFISNQEEEELRQKISELQVRIDGEPNEQKKQGMGQGIISLQAKIEKLKPVNIWSRIQSDIFRLRSMMDNVFKFYDLCVGSETNLEKIKDRPSLIKEKDKLQKNIAQLKANFVEFEAFFETYQVKLAELIVPVLGQDRADALWQESIEVIGEELNHYNSDKNTLKSIFNDKEADNKLKGREMKVAIASRSMQDLYLGNYCPCCICIDSEYHGSESPIADYVTDLGMQNIVVYDEKKNVPVVVCWTFVGENSSTGEPIMVIDNIEANTDYSVDYGGQISDNIARFVNNYAQASKIKEIVQGPHNNDLVIFSNQEVQSKLGKLYNREGGYYLEAEQDDDYDNEDEDEDYDEEDD